MARKFEFDPEDEEFFSKVGSFGVPKFDNEMHGGIPRGFTLIAFTAVSYTHLTLPTKA